MMRKEKGNYAGAVVCICIKVGLGMRDRQRYARGHGQLTARYSAVRSASVTLTELLSPLRAGQQCRAEKRRARREKARSRGAG